MDHLLERARPEFGLDVVQALASVEHRMFGTRPDLVQVDRYLLVEPLGAGGWGVVYRAHDPELEREVAIKLRRTGGGTRAEDEILLGEARLIAGLSHPNIVSIHDVGTYELEEDDGSTEREAALPPRGVYAVMELVRGQTLSEWLREKPRSSREIISVFVQAGRGLAAAHAEGIVHHDFKPSNVLLGRNGCVRVADFGLARRTDARALDAADARSGDSCDVLGTPLYMAPEQYRGARSDARADQYSFCAALYEGLYGRPPFFGADPEALQSSKVQGRVPLPPPRSGVPRRVHRALLRGLSPDPEQRFRTLNDLLSRLEPPARRRRFLAITLVGLAGAFGGASLTRETIPAAAVCSEAAPDFTGIWDATTRERTRRAFLESNKPYAADAWERYASGVDAYAAGISQLWTSSCEAGQGLTPASVAARLECMDRRMRDLAELTRMFANAELDGNADALEHAAQSLATLRPLTECEDITAPYPQWQERRRAVLDMDGRLIRAQILRRTAQYDEALREVQEAMRMARELGQDDLEASRLRGQIETDLGHYDQAVETLLATMTAAERAGDDRMAIRVLVDRIQAELLRGRTREAENLLPLASARMDRHQLGPTDQAELAAVTGRLLADTGRHAESLAAHERALNLLQQAGAPEHQQANATLRLSLGLLWLGRYTEARDRAMSALELAANAYGPRHPGLAGPKRMLVFLELIFGNHEDALRHAQENRALLSATLDFGHPEVVATLNDLARVHAERGELESAVRYNRECLASLERSLGSEHRGIAVVLEHLGRDLSHLGHHEEARELLTRSLTIYEREAPENPGRGFPLVYLGNVELALGNTASALELHERASERWQSTMPPGHPWTALARAGIGRVHLAAGRREEAIATLEQALTDFEIAGVRSLVVAEAELALAMALWPEDPDRARTRGARAAELYRGRPGFARNPAATWLASVSED